MPIREDNTVSYATVENFLISQNMVKMKASQKQRKSNMSSKKQNNNKKALTAILSRDSFCMSFMFLATNDSVKEVVGGQRLCFADESG